MERAGIVEVARFSTLPEAELVVTLLRDRGIEAYLPDRQMANSMPHLHIAIGNLRVVAPVEQAAQARDLIARARDGEFTASDKDDGDWRIDDVPGRVGELDEGDIQGVLGSVKSVGVGLILTLVGFWIVAALWPSEG